MLCILAVCGSCFQFLFRQYTCSSVQSPGFLSILPWSSGCCGSFWRGTVEHIVLWCIFLCFSTVFHPSHSFLWCYTMMCKHLLLSRYNGSWLDSTWVVLGLSSRRKASYRSFCSLRDFARLERWLSSLSQTILCCSPLPWWGDKNSGYEEGQWGPIATDDESESWSNSKGTQLRGIGRSERDVVVLQEIEPKVRFLILQGLYTYRR